MNEEWYDNLIDDCKTIITETLYRSRQELIEGKHQLGERICTDKNFNKLSGSKSATLQRIFKDVGIGQTEGYACVKFYEKYPKLSAGLESFTEQKNISWNKIVRNYLPAKIEQKDPCTHEDIIKICNDCKIRVK